MRVGATRSGGDGVRAVVIRDVPGAREGIQDAQEVDLLHVEAGLEVLDGRGFGDVEVEVHEFRAGRGDGFGQRLGAGGVCGLLDAHDGRTNAETEYKPMRKGVGSPSMALYGYT